jgi:nucleoid-associated protein YgaU
MLPSAYPPPEPMPVTVIEAQPPSATHASSTHKAASSQGKYIVKHGDTLYHIAKVRYGDGKQWQQIASANPGVSPTTLKVGQVLVIP